jgi:single-strand selective monofunctional uracil DNA glycosylase
LSPRRRAAAADPLAITARLSRRAGRLRFGPPVTHVYNPLVYARAPHEEYLSRYAGRGREALLLGMNPGPWGMAQTGVPFGDPPLVREWMGIDEPVRRPRREHPRRPVRGFDSPRREVSGRRLWGWARSRFGEARSFFDRFLVLNYCPLAFLEETGRNRTPDRLPADERERLESICDEALAEMVEALRPGTVIGIGRFAERRARLVLGRGGIVAGSIPHPSPASPVANQDWAGAAETALAGLGIEI